MDNCCNIKLSVPTTETAGIPCSAAIDGRPTYISRNLTSVHTKATHRRTLVCLHDLLGNMAIVAQFVVMPTKLQAPFPEACFYRNQ
jgi:hypothetical protein